MIQNIFVQVKRWFVNNSDVLFLVICLTLAVFFIILGLGII